MSERTGTQVLESIEGLLGQLVVNSSEPKQPAVPLNSALERTIPYKTFSDDTKDLYKALATTQKNFRELQKTGVITGRNTRYAKLSDLFDASLKALLEQDLVCNTYMRVGYLVTRLTHYPTGQYIESELQLLNTTEEQKRGSSITYAWRYTYAPLIGLVDSSYDDDAEITKVLKR